MSRAFSLPTVLRKTPKALLARLLAALGHDGLEVPWEELAEEEIAPIQDALSRLPRGKRDGIEAILRSVHELACEQGTFALLDAAALAGDTEFPTAVPADGSFHH